MADVESTATAATEPDERSQHETPSHVERHREIVRRLRRADADRVQAEKKAAESLKSATGAAESVYQAATKRAGEAYGLVKEVFESAGTLLAKADALELFRQTPVPTPIDLGLAALGVGQVAEGLNRCVQASEAAMSDLKRELTFVYRSFVTEKPGVPPSVVERTGVQTVRPGDEGSWNFVWWMVGTLFAGFLAIVVLTSGDASGAMFFAVLTLALLLISIVLWNRRFVNTRLTLVREKCNELARAMAEAQAWYTRWLAIAQETRDRDVAAARAKHEQEAKTVQTAYLDQIAATTQDLSALTSGAGRALVPWSAPEWRSWSPGPFPIPTARIGGLRCLQQQADPLVPALTKLPGERSVLFRAPGAATGAAIAAVQSLMLRLLAQIPPGKLNFTLVDPVGLGQSVAPFMALADYDESLVGGRAWSDSQHIEQRLADLTEHMENVIQKYLRGQYATIEDYNAQAEVPEAYRVLVVTGFPVNFSEIAARRLVSIAQNGPRCGVFAIVVADPEQPSPYGFDLADLERVTTTIAWKDERWVWEDEDFRDCLLTLDEPPDSKLFDRIIQMVGERAKDAKRVEVPFARVAPAREAWWAADSSGGLRVPLGPAGANKLQYLDLGQGTAQHTLVVGKTGSGKSTLLHAMITGLALAYSPEEVQLYLIDFKKGVEFKTYADQALPHARVIAIESEREFGLSVVQGLDAELKQRGDLFRAAGVDGLADYRRKAGKTMPRILLLVDEFQEFFTEDDAVKTRSEQILDRLVRQGRAFGIHVLLGSQTLAGAYSLARSTIDQMGVRIALQCSEADSRLILADDNPAARLLSRPGEAIYNAANGTVEGNNTFQVAWLPDEERDRCLEALHEMAEQRGYRPSQIVFEGNAPAEIAQNQPLGDLLDGREPAAPARAPLAWLGEPVAMKDPTAAVFRRQSGSNLLIAGQNDEAALGMLLSSLVSLAARQRFNSRNAAGGGSQFYILDFGAADAPYAGLLRRLPDLLQRPVRVAGRRDLPEVVDEIAAEVDRRLEHDESGAAPIYLAIFGLQRARDLRQEDEFATPSFSSFPGDEPPPPPSPAKRFPTILREGPNLGVHTIVWCDTLTNLNRALDRRSLREFAMRAVFQMSAEDSSNLIDTPAASKLGLHRAFFFDEEQGQLEKFRPYGLPPVEWLAGAGSRLAAISGAVQDP